MFGEDAFEDEVLHYMIGRQSVVQPWADKREKQLIAEYGGVLQDMSKRLKQTLNLDVGGKGQQAFVSKVAFRNECFQRFKEEMEAYVEAQDEPSSLVPTQYVNPVTGYKLGIRLSNFRTGHMRNGMPNKGEIEAWAESLPKWAWNAMKTDDWRTGCSQNRKQYWEDPNSRTAASERGKKQFESAEARAALSERSKKQFESAEARAAVSERSKKQFESAEARAALSERSKKQFESVEARAAASERGKAQAANETAEAKAERLAKKEATHRIKTEARLAQLSPRSRQRAEAKIESEKRKTEKKRKDLALLRSMGGEWKNATSKDLSRARQLGVLPNENEDRSKRKKRKKRVTTTTTTVTEYKTETESSEDELDEAIAGSSSSAPLPKRRRRDDSDSD